jgi:hypothetical protein
VIDLYEMMRTAWGAEPERALAERTGVSAAVTEAAMRALLPAFTVAMRKAAETPEGARHLLALLAGPDAARAADEATAALPEPLKAEGREILSEVFGSERVQRAVAAQAAAQAGVGEAVMLEMMPALAGSIARGFARAQAANPFLAPFLAPDAPPETKAAPDDPARQLFEAGMSIGEAQMRAVAEALDRAWGLGERS